MKFMKMDDNHEEQTETRKFTVQKGNGKEYHFERVEYFTDLWV